MGFEPTRAEHIGLAVQRLNHSATSSEMVKGLTVPIFVHLLIFQPYILCINDSQSNPPEKDHPRGFNSRIQITLWESLYAKECVWRNYLQVSERRVVIIRTIFDVQYEHCNVYFKMPCICSELRCARRTHRKQPVGVVISEKVMDKQQLCTLSHFSTLFSSPLYACETWTVHKRHLKDLKRFHLNCLRKLLKIIWLENLPNTEVLSLADLHARHSHSARPK